MPKAFTLAIWGVQIVSEAVLEAIDRAVQVEQETDTAAASSSGKQKLGREERESARSE
jgi:hypothetical protein